MQKRDEWRGVKNRGNEGGRRVGELKEQQTNDNSNNNTSTFVFFLRKSCTDEQYSPEKRQAVACLCPQANNRAILILCKRR
jgi:hypothetical protein